MERAADTGTLADIIASGELYSLTDLFLDSNQMGPAGCILLVGGICATPEGTSLSLPKLKFLTLDKNRLGDAGTIAIVQAFASMPHLERLGLRHNQVGDAGVRAIAEACTAKGAQLGASELLWLPKLSTIDLSENEMSAAGVRALAGAIFGGAWPRMTASQARMRDESRPPLSSTRLSALLLSPLSICVWPSDDSSLHAQLQAREQTKQLLGERLFHLISAVEPQLAGKITGMLLEMDNGKILNLLESPEALNAKIMEAISVLQIHAADPVKEE